MDVLIEIILNKVLMTPHERLIYGYCKLSKLCSCLEVHWGYSTAPQRFLERTSEDTSQLFQLALAT